MAGMAASKQRWRLQLWKGFGILKLAEVVTNTHNMGPPGVYPILDRISAELSNGRELVITFTLGEAKSPLLAGCINIDMPECSSVRVTSVLCLLGVGLGLGSLLLYKIISKFLTSDDDEKDQRESSIPPVDICIGQFHDLDPTHRRSPQTPSDSGVSCDSGMGNVSSAENMPDSLGAYYMGNSDKVRFRGFRRSPSQEDNKVITTPLLQAFASDLTSDNSSSGGQGFELYAYHQSQNGDGSSATESTTDRVSCPSHLDLDIPSGYLSVSASELDLKSPDSMKGSMYGNFSPESLNERIERVRDFCESRQRTPDTEVDSVFDDSSSQAQTTSEPGLEYILPMHKELIGSDSELSFGDSSLGFSTPGRLSNLNSDVENSPERCLRDKVLTRSSQSLTDPLRVETPDSELMTLEDVGKNTQHSMEKIMEEIGELKETMHDLNNAILSLSCDNLAGILLENHPEGCSKPKELQNALKVIRRHKRPNSSNRSISASDDVDSMMDPLLGPGDESSNHRNTSYHNEYYWKSLQTLNAALTDESHSTSDCMPSDNRESNFVASLGDITPSLGEIRGYLDIIARENLGETAELVETLTKSQLKVIPNCAPTMSDTLSGLLPGSSQSNSHNIGQGQVTDQSEHETEGQGHETYQSEQDKVGQVPCDNTNGITVNGGTPAKKCLDNRTTKCILQSTNSDPLTCNGPTEESEIDFISVDKAVNTTHINGRKGKEEGCKKCKAHRALYSSVGEKQDMLEYARREWRGRTQQASRIRRGYENVVRQYRLRHIQKVRGDNYCPLRAMLYQVLVSGYPLLDHIGTQEDVIKEIEAVEQGEHAFLQQWKFGGRLSYTRERVQQGVTECIQCLFTQVSPFTRVKAEDRELRAMEVFSDEVRDIQLMEALKLLMMLKAVSLYSKSTAGDDVPTFVWLMFARDTSENPQTFLANHLNRVGGTCGLEQVEMVLLAHTLSISIRVLRLAQYGQEDFEAEFMDDTQNSTHSVVLLAEDDRHYNLAVP